MDTRSPTPDARPAGPPDGTEPTDGAMAFPISGAPRLDGFLDPPARPDEIGRFGPYRILGVLGRGGMGAVYRAEDPRLKRELAIKVLLPELTADPRAKARFVREAQAQAKVEHDHIVAIHQIGEANGVPFIAMPLLKGQSLAAALLQNPRPPLNEVVRIGREIAAGLAAAHAAGLIHRDIKPSNIWLEGPKRRVKILDFGLARGAGPISESGSEPITGAGAIMGTPAYMSPEQARSQPADPRSDLFSLGAVLYQMTTGKMPFTGTSVFDVIAAVVSHDPPPVLAVAPDVSPEVADLIHRLLAKNPEGRPRSAEAVAEELEGFEHERTLPQGVRPVVTLSDGSAPSDPWVDVALSQTEPEAAEEHAGRRWLWAAVAGVGLIALVALALVLNRKPKEVVENPQPPPVVPVVPAVDVAPLPHEPARPFFNGKDLDGWEGLPQHWTVKDGAIVGTIQPGQEGTFLCSKQKYTDFELAFDVKLTGGHGNSGVQIRSRQVPPGSFQVIGPQCDIGVGYWGTLYGPEKSGYRKKPPAEFESRVIRVKGFNEYAIRCVGKRVTITINDVVAVDGEFALPDDGIIAWQANLLTTEKPTNVEITFLNIRFTDLRK